MKLIPRIKERRMEKHMSQKELAAKININISQLSRIENGHNKPSPEILWLIAEGINCKVDDLYEVSK